MRRFVLLFVPALLLAAGCKTSYSWTSPAIPESARKVAVPVFRNESDVTELGTICSRQILREIQREGSYKVARPSNAGVEIQGVIKYAGAGGGFSSRHSASRVIGYEMTMTANVSVIDKRNGKVLIDNHTYVAKAPFATNSDIQTGLRNASGRVAEDLARQVVEDLLGIAW